MIPGRARGITLGTMPKPRRAPRPPTTDDTVNELARHARGDRGENRADIGRTREDAEADALDDQRATYENIVGKSLRRRNMSQRDERGPLDDEDDVEDERARRPQLDDDDDELEEGEEIDDDDRDTEDDEAPRVGKKELERAKNALRRAGAPSWVFDEDPERVLELAGSFAGYQSNADRALTQQREVIQSLTAALAGGTGQARASGENLGDQTPSEDDLDRHAEGLARALGVEGDLGTKKALLDYARAVRGPRSTSAEAEKVARLEAMLRDMVLAQGVKSVRKLYSERMSDPANVQALKQRAVILSADKAFENDVPALFKAAASSLWGESSSKAVNGRARARRGSATVTQTRRDRRPDRASTQGTEDHDRAVYRAVTKRSRGRFAVRR